MNFFAKLPATRERALARAIACLLAYLLVFVAARSALAQDDHDDHHAAAPAHGAHAPAAKPDPKAAAAHGHAKADDAAPEAKQDDAKKDDGDKKDDEAKKDEPKTPTKMKVGLTLTKLNKFELGPGTYNAEFYVTFTCDREPCKPDFDVTNGKLVGKPEKEVDEKLRKQFKVKAELEAFVDLSDYPFDYHLLPIGVMDKNAHVVQYELDENASSMDDDIRLPGWEVSPKFSSNVEHHKIADGTQLDELQFMVAIKRPAMASFFKSIMPLFFLLFVAGFTLLLKPKSAAGRLAAGTGGITAAVAFHLGQINSLPPLGYLTRMDKFMLASYFVYVASVAFSVYMVRAEEKKNEKASELAYLIAGGAVPGIALIGWTAVFLKIV